MQRSEGMRAPPSHARRLLPLDGVVHAVGPALHRPRSEFQGARERSASLLPSGQFGELGSTALTLCPCSASLPGYATGRGTSAHRSSVSEPRKLRASFSHPETSSRGALAGQALSLSPARAPERSPELATPGSPSTTIVRDVEGAIRHGCWLFTAYHRFAAAVRTRRIRVRAADGSAVSWKISCGGETREPLEGIALAGALARSGGHLSRHVPRRSPACCGLRTPAAGEGGELLPARACACGRAGASSVPVDHALRIDASSARHSSPGAHGHFRSDAGSPARAPP